MNVWVKAITYSDRTLETHEDASLAVQESALVLSVGIMRSSNLLIHREKHGFVGAGGTKTSVDVGHNDEVK